MGKYFLSFIFIFFHLMLLSQNQGNNWVFGNKVTLNFNTGIPIPSFNSQMIASAGCASISDEFGALLFYTNGIEVWNRNNVTMLNGTGLLGWHGSTQSAVIVQKPEDPFIYYIFTVDALGRPNGLRYSTVDIRMDNGLGAVVQKNELVITPVCEKISAISACNGKDIWIVSHKMNSYEYCSFLLSNTGLNLTPVISVSPYFVGNGPCNAEGYLKVSPDGKKIAACHACTQDFLEVADFNRTTGYLTNFAKLSTKPTSNLSVFTGAYGVDFSPSSRFIYVSAVYGSSADSSYIYQFDVTQPSPFLIQNSRILIDKYASTSIGHTTAVQLGPDKKIYIAHTPSAYLSVINNPNNLGLNSNFSRFALNVNNGDPLNHIVRWGLPNFVQSYLKNPIISTGNCLFQNVSFSISDVVDLDSVKWNFGDPASGFNNQSTSFNPTHIFSSQGQFSVVLSAYYRNSCAVNIFTKIVHAGPFRVDLGADKSFCKGDSIKLSMHIPNGRTTWSTGSTDTSVYIKQPGTYWVRVNLGDCVASDTIVITENQLPQFSLGADTIICNNASVSLASNTAFANSSYLWSNGNTNAVNTVNAAGIHWLQITDANSCKWRDSINVSFKTLPNFSLGNDTAICQNDTITLNATVAGATSYAWSTGATTAIIKAYNNTTYWCDVNKEGCVYRDSIQLTVKPLPIVNLGNDTTICEDKTYLLNVTNPNSNYLWQNGSTQPTFTVTEAGNYYVTVNRNNCVLKDTVAIQYQLRPRFTLGADRLICPGLTITLDPQLTTTGLSYLWQDGTTLTTYTATQQGLYYVAISNNCGDTRDSVAIVRGLCKVHVPTAFTPNNDGINDIFRVGGGEAVKDFRMTVFSRWGKKVFETNNIQSGWNGTFNGTAQPVGTYIFYISYTDNITNEKLQQKGSVLLIK